jgi:hypothetical protein
MGSQRIDGSHNEYWHNRLRAELDACYARLYDLICDELRYTSFGVDPKEVSWESFLFSFA